MPKMRPRIITAWAESSDLAKSKGWRLKIVGWGDADYVRQVRSDIRQLALTNLEIKGPAFGDDKVREYRGATLRPSIT